MTKQTGDNTSFTRICKSCGAGVESGVATCPYCGNTDFREADKAHRETMHSIAREKAALDKESKRFKKKRLSKAAIALIIAALLLLILVLLSRDTLEYIGLSIRSRVMESTYSAELDNYLARSDYEGFYQFHREHGIGYGGGYKAYYTADSMSYTYRSFCDNLEDLETEYGTLRKDDCIERIASAITRYYRLLSEEEDYNRYGNIQKTDPGNFSVMEDLMREKLVEKFSITPETFDSFRDMKQAAIEDLLAAAWEEKNP